MESPNTWYESEWRFKQAQEKEAYVRAEMLTYLLSKSGKQLPIYLENITGKKLEQISVRLAAELKRLNPEQLEKYVYNAHSRTSRSLANFYEEYVEEK